MLSSITGFNMVRIWTFYFPAVSTKCKYYFLSVTTIGFSKIISGFTSFMGFLKMPHNLHQSPSLFLSLMFIKFPVHDNTCIIKLLYVFGSDGKWCPVSLGSHKWFTYCSMKKKAREGRRSNFRISIRAIF